MKNKTKAARTAKPLHELRRWVQEYVDNPSSAKILHDMISRALAERAELLEALEGFAICVWKARAVIAKAAERKPRP